MKCADCKWFAGQSSDQYGLCKRYPISQNKTQQDWCGEFNAKLAVETIFEYSETSEIKRRRKPKNDS